MLSVEHTLRMPAAEACDYDRLIYYSKYFFLFNLSIPHVGITRSVQRVVTDWTVRGSNPCKRQDFRSRPDRPWDPPSLLHNEHRVFRGGKTAGAWV